MRFRVVAKVDLGLLGSYEGRRRVKVKLVCWNMRDQLQSKLWRMEMGCYIGSISWPLIGSFYKIHVL